MRLAQVQFIKGKPYFLYRVVWNREGIRLVSSRYPQARYYYTKIIDGRTQRAGYAVYLDRKVVFG